MIYKIIETLDSNLIEKTPKEIIDFWREGLCIIAEAKETENDIIGVAAFMMPYANGKNIVLSYVNVADEYRRKGVATALVQKTIDIMAVRGFNTVRVVMPYNDPDKSLVSFLKSIHFTSRNETVNYVSFVLGKIKESELYQKVICQEVLMNKVKAFDEVTTDQIDAFRQELMQEQNIVLKEEFDKDLVCFYTQDNKIVALSDYSQTAVYEISRSYIYSLKELDGQLAFPTMFVYFISKALETKSEDTIIRMFVYAKSEYRGLTTTVGEDITVEPVTVYERKV